MCRTLYTKIIPCVLTAAMEDAIFSYLHNKKLPVSSELLFSRHAGSVCIDAKSHACNTSVVCVPACLLRCYRAYACSSLYQPYKVMLSNSPLQMQFESFRISIR